MGLYVPRQLLASLLSNHLAVEQVTLFHNFLSSAGCQSCLHLLCLLPGILVNDLREGAVLSDGPYQPSW